MDSFLPYGKPNITDFKLDSDKVNFGTDDDRYRQRIEIAGQLAAAIADVLNGNPAGNAYGLTVRNIPYVYTSILDDRKVVAAAGTREQLKTVSTPCKLVVITALGTNTKDVVVGSVAVVADAAGRIGTPLISGQSTAIYIDDLNKIYVDVEQSGEGILFTYFN